LQRQGEPGGLINRWKFKISRKMRGGKNEQRKNQVSLW